MNDFMFRFKSLFMSRSQVIYLFSIFIGCTVFGALSGAIAFYDIGLGTRYYSFSLFINCIISCLYCWFSADMKKKRWIFMHYKAIDLGETIFFTLSNTVFLIIYIEGIFYKIVSTFISTIIPSIGDVYEQSLYKNQIDYQNHSRAEGLMSCFGAAAGAAISWMVGDFFKYHPKIIFLTAYINWIEFYCRWQFYFNKENYAIIKRNFAKDCGEWRRNRK